MERRDERTYPTVKMMLVEIVYRELVSLALNDDMAIPYAIRASTQYASYKWINPGIRVACKTTVSFTYSFAE